MDITGQESHMSTPCNKPSQILSAPCHGNMSHKVSSYRRHVTNHGFTSFVWTSKSDFRTRSSSWTSWFFSSRTLILSLRWIWRRSFDSNSSLSTVAERRALCSSSIFSRWRAFSEKNTTTHLGHCNRYITALITYHLHLHNSTNLICST